MSLVELLPNDSKFFLRLYLILTAAVLASLFSVYGAFKTNLLSEVVNVTEKDVDDVKSLFIEEIADATNDVFILKNLMIVNQVSDAQVDSSFFDNPQKVAAIADEFRVWMSFRDSYDQIRVLDPLGQERVRVNYNSGDPVVVPREQLQNKADRYYFAESVVLDDLEVYLSPLDLNVENGEIEIIDGQPKPMIRIASPIFDQQGNKIGVLIVNYLAQKLFDALDRLHQQYTNNAEVFNDTGHYLYSLEEDRLFGFMYPERDAERFNKYHNFDLAELKATKVKTFYDEDYYTSVFIDSKNLSRGASLGALQDINVVTDVGGYYIVALVKPSAIQRYLSLNYFFFLLAILLSIVTILVARLIDASRHLNRLNLARAKFDATHDTLTGLPNRKSMLEDIAYLLARKQRFTLMFVDLDGFKLVNDRFGHKVGDQALVEAVARINKQIRKNDTLGRYGGDEFLILLKDMTGRKMIERLAKQLIESFVKEFGSDGQKYHMGMSIGIVVNDSSEMSVNEMLLAADRAMYDVKQNGKNSFKFAEVFSGEASTEARLFPAGGSPRPK